MTDYHTPERLLASFVADLAFEDIPTDLVDLAERAFVDTVGVTLAGATADAGRRAASFATAHAGPSGGSSLFGREETAPLPSAALANAAAGHALDYDDLSWGMDGHPSVPLVAPILSLGEAIDASGAKAITAYVAGFETQCYLAEPISPKHYEAGWHPTATFGTFGAAAAACSLLNLDREATERALGIAASMPSGLKRNFGSMTKPLHPGLAARSGVTAALLADDGFTSGDVPVSGDRGFFDLYGDGASSTLTPPGNPYRLRTEGISVKYYPCCYFTHTSITATTDLVDEHNLEPSDIEAIEVAAAKGADDALGYTDPRTGLEAKFSMEYCVAAAAVYDRVGLAAFEDETVDDPEVQSVMERVSFEVDDSLEYDDQEATVAVVTVDGERHERHQEDPPGVPEAPLTEAELREKYLECAAYGAVDDATAKVTHDRLASLAEESSVADVVGDLSLR